jgi:hypothetical protein
MNGFYNKDIYNYNKIRMVKQRMDFLGYLYRGNGEIT